MKTTIVAAIGILALVGCASEESGVDRASAAGKNMQEMRKLLADSNQQIDKTVNALNSLSAVKSGDPKPAYESFVAENKATHALADDIKATADAMRAKGRAFFAEWEKQIESIKDPELKAKAKARAEERSKDYSKIEEATGTAKGKWATFSGELNDLKTYLQNDLNLKGIEGAAPIFKKANLSAVELKNAIGAISGHLDRVAAELAPQAAK